MLFLTDNIHQNPPKDFPGAMPPPLLGGLIRWETSEKLAGGSKILISIHDMVLLNQNHFLDMYSRNGEEWGGYTGVY